MGLNPEPPRRGPPHNPALREVVQGKRRWALTSPGQLARLGFKGWHERGYLPHRDEPGLIQFVTFRLVDSFPESLRGEWAHLWKIENDRERRRALEEYLDKGRGAAWLKRPDIAAVVEESIRWFHPQWYELLSWVVMPNHVHVLFRSGTVSMGEIVGSWKKHSAGRINRVLGRSGSFWQRDYWDTYMRDEEHAAKSRRYIESNPARAGLSSQSASWPWSSARLRDEFGRLRI